MANEPKGKRHKGYNITEYSQNKKGGNKWEMKRARALRQGVKSGE